MAIEILEIHHTGIRIDNAGSKLADTEKFYKDVLGLGRDEGRPTIPGIPGAWINVGEVGQIHLIGGAQPSPVAKGPGEDPTRPHVAFAVKDIGETRKEFDRMGLDFWPSQGNFYLVKVPKDAKQIYEAMLRKGVIIRPVTPYGLKDCLRVTIGTQAENKRMIESFEKTLSELQ